MDVQMKQAQPATRGRTPGHATHGSVGATPPDSLSASARDTETRRANAGPHATSLAALRSVVAQRECADCAHVRRAMGGAEPAQRAARNPNGLPDGLRAGLEQLSGRDLSGVTVNYNSPKPAQLNAHAYAQGSTIHVAPGQERHLPHEGWHAVQQMQNRVRPTLSLGGTPVNDSAALEREADVMGGRARATQRRTVDAPPTASGPGALTAQRQGIDGPIQLKDDKPTFTSTIASHMEAILAEKGGDTTVDALYDLYEAFTAHVDLSTDAFAILLEAKNVNPGGLHQGPQSRSLLDLRQKVLPVFADNAEQIQILRTDLTDTPLGLTIDFDTLLKKMGEGDVQGPKLHTLVQEIMLGNDLYALALRIGARIDPTALQSFRGAYAKSITSAESKVLKKINRELNAALAVLTHDRSVTLKMSSVSYSLPMLSENAEFDLLFGVNGTEERVLVEVQSIPDRLGGEPAYEDEPDLSEWNPETRRRLIEYLVTTMYEKRQRLSLVQDQLGALRDVPMVLMTTRPLPRALNDALTASGMFLPVMQEHLSLNEVINDAVVKLRLGTEKTKEKLKRLAANQEEAAQLKRAPAQPVAQRMIIATRNGYEFTAAQAYASLKSELGAIPKSLAMLYLETLDAENARFHDYKNLVADVERQAGKMARIRGLGTEQIGALTQGDIMGLSAWELAAFKPEQHEALSGDQITWFNQALATRGQPEVRQAIAAEPETTNVRDEATEIYRPSAAPPGGTLYHEKQKYGWCGKHALNAFLGETGFTTRDVWDCALQMNDENEEAARQHVSMENPDEARIGDVSEPLMARMLENKGILSSNYALSELSDEALDELLKDSRRMILVAGNKTKFPGETVHSHGHYAAARRDADGKWWVINSTAAKQVQVNPRDFSKALSIIIEIGPERIKSDALAAAARARQIADMTFEDWKDPARRAPVVNAIQGLIATARRYVAVSKEVLLQEQYLTELDKTLSSAIMESLDWDEVTFEVKSTLSATEHDFAALATLAQQL